MGTIFLDIFSFFSNMSFENNEKNYLIDKLNVDVDYSPVDGITKFDRFRIKFINYALNRYVLILLGVFFALAGIFLDMDLAAAMFIMILMIYFYVLYYPNIKMRKKYDDLNQNLPYALRHIGIELKSGKGLHDSMVTIRNSNYGSLSDEFNRVLEEIKYGNSTEDSLIGMSHRVNSEGLSRAIHQIIGTLRVGGNLANSLEIIANDITFDMHIKLKEYSQKLNSFILIYTFVAILLPVITLIMLMAATTVIGDVISSSILFMLYSLFFPLLVVFMGVFMKHLEPKI